MTAWSMTRAWTLLRNLDQMDIRTVPRCLTPYLHRERCGVPWERGQFQVPCFGKGAPTQQPCKANESGGR